MSLRPNHAGRDVIGATHILVLRLSLERGGAVPHVRIEDVETHEVQHFSDIDAAIDELRAWLRRLACEGGRGEAGA